MASSSYSRKAYWPNTFVLTEKQVKECFTGYEVISFTEHKTSGVALDGTRHNWHIYAVVAQKALDGAT